MLPASNMPIWSSAYKNDLKVVKFTKFVKSSNSVGGGFFTNSNSVGGGVENNLNSVGGGVFFDLRSYPPRPFFLE